MANFPTISADTIASIGDPWVAEMQKRRLESELSSLPRGPGGGIDYNAAALKIMPLNPFAAQQLIKMAGQQQTAGQHGAELALRGRQLDILQSQEDKPIIQEDEDTGYHYVFRPVSQQGRWITGPKAGQPINMGAPIPRMMPGTGAPRSQNTAPGGSSAPVPTPSPVITPPTPAPPQQSQGGQVEVAPGVSLSQDEIEALRQNPQAAKQFEAYYKLPPGTAQRLLGTGQRSELGAETVPSETYPGGVARMAGPQVSEMSPEIGQAFGQSTGPTAGGAPGPSDPLGVEYGAPSGKDIREGRKAYQKELAQESAKQQVKNREKAVELRNKLPAIDEMLTSFDQINKAGLANRAVQNPIVGNALPYAKGIYNLFGGQEGQGQTMSAIDAMDTYNRNLRQLQLMAQESMRGLGPMSDRDANVVLQSLPSLNSNDPVKVREALVRVRAIMVNSIRRGGMEP